MSNYSLQFIILFKHQTFMMMTFIKYHYVYDFETGEILKDLRAIIDKLNKTIEIFNGMNHKTIKSVRKQLLYLHDKFKLIEQSIKDHHTSFISIKI